METLDHELDFEEFHFDQEGEEVDYLEMITRVEQVVAHYKDKQDQQIVALLEQSSKLAAETELKDKHLSEQQA